MDSDLVQAMRQLNDRDMAIFTAETNRRRKSVGIAYLLWFFLGFFGVHKFYLGKVSAYAYLASAGVTIWFVFAGDNSPVGFLVIFALAYLGISLLVDLFTLPWQVNKANDAVAWEVINGLAEDDAEPEEASTTPAPSSPQPH